VDEEHDLTFPEPEEQEVFEGDSVKFWGQDGQTRIRCEINREAWDDRFDGDGKDKLETFSANRRAIEEIARRQYLAGWRETDLFSFGSEDL